MRTERDDWITVRPEGLYCVPGDFYIDPWRPVERALLTHGHGDHARPGSRHYVAVRQANDLQPPREASRELVILAAARLGNARLIDNLKLTLIEKR